MKENTQNSGLNSQDNMIRVQAFFKMVDKDDEVIANVNINKNICCNDKEFSSNKLYDLFKESIIETLPKDCIIKDLSQEEFLKLEETKEHDSLALAKAKDKYLKLFSKYSDDDTLDVKTAKKMIETIFSEVKNEDVVENTEEKKLNCFVIGLMDLKETNFLLTKGREVFLKASHLSVLDSKADMENIENIISLNLDHLDYEEIHNFCTEFLLAESQGLINSEIVENFK